MRPPRSDPRTLQISRPPLRRTWRRILCVFAAETGGAVRCGGGDGVGAGGDVAGALQEAPPAGRD